MKKNNITHMEIYMLAKLTSRQLKNGEISIEFAREVLKQIDNDLERLEQEEINRYFFGPGSEFDSL